MCPNGQIVFKCVPRRTNPIRMCATTYKSFSNVCPDEQIPFECVFRRANPFQMCVPTYKSLSNDVSTYESPHAAGAPLVADGAIVVAAGAPLVAAGGPCPLHKCSVCASTRCWCTLTRCWCTLTRCWGAPTYKSCVNACPDVQIPFECVFDVRLFLEGVPRRTLSNCIGVKIKVRHKTQTKNVQPQTKNAKLQILFSWG